jgi:hypothetical protein
VDSLVIRSRWGDRDRAVGRASSRQVAVVAAATASFVVSSTGILHLSVLFLLGALDPPISASRARASDAARDVSAWLTAVPRSDRSSDVPHRLNRSSR